MPTANEQQAWMQFRAWMEEGDKWTKAEYEEWLLSLGNLKRIPNGAIVRVGGDFDPDRRSPRRWWQLWRWFSAV